MNIMVGCFTHHLNRKHYKLVCFMSKMIVAFFLALLICLYTGFNAVGAENQGAGKQEMSQPPPGGEISSPKPNFKVPPNAPAGGRDPMSVPDDIQQQMGDVKPPDVRITGIVVAGKQKAAMAELNLENYKGEVMLEPGMTVSIPKPDRDESMSNRWMTFFTVKDITGQGVLIALGNGETIWFPLMGENE